MSNLTAQQREALSAIGTIGGRAGKGEAKRRGDRAYYEAIGRKGAEAKKAKALVKADI